MYLDATGRQNARVQFNARDLDGSADNAIQQLNVQYRIGETDTVPVTSTLDARNAAPVVGDGYQAGVAPVLCQRAAREIEISVRHEDTSA